MKLWSLPEFIDKNMSHEHLAFIWFTVEFVIVAWVESWNIFEKLMKLYICQNFFRKICFTNNWLSYDSHFVMLAWVENWNIFENFTNYEFRQNIFTKICFTNTCLSYDSRFVILAWQAYGPINEQRVHGPSAVQLLQWDSCCTEQK